MSVDLIETYRGAIYPWHCDHLGHMNNMWYAGKFDEASWNLLLQLGVSPSYQRQNARGVAAVEQNTNFVRELMAGDVVEVRSEILEIREKTMRCRHTMFNADTGEVAATCEIVGVHVDMAARKSCPFPQELRAGAERLAGLAKAA